MPSCSANHCHVRQRLGMLITALRGICQGEDGNIVLAPMVKTGNGVVLIVTYTEAAEEGELTRAISLLSRDDASCSWELVIRSAHRIHDDPDHAGACGPLCRIRSLILGVLSF
ncbi:hypothetical protein K461DRAFT_21834 [Myriangium duriaei CBS 260.36]|uniref:Uncharacterized protein n=1 Tax=Myriangium duriaei CBS 260.36 TaxID=1168546 RepID=A0A9P4JDG7_9PEZI|nr:hypothetical protein K461DRAFT_21834 [Myriangium duriaei CBS 260.36]